MKRVYNIQGTVINTGDDAVIGDAIVYLKEFRHFNSRVSRYYFNPIPTMIHPLELFPEPLLKEANIATVKVDLNSIEGDIIELNKEKTRLLKILKDSK
jgi:hypothetical protein